MAALFGGSTDSRREPKSLVEFRAGKMKLSGSTVTADTRKGLVYMKLAGEDGLLHFYWKDRKNSQVVDDFIILPGSAEMKKVTQCKTGRVFLLKFKEEHSRKFFYWLQEPKEDKDEDYLKKVNELIENPPDPSSESHGLSQGGGGFGPHPTLQSMLAGGHATPQLLEQLLSAGMLSNRPFDGPPRPSASASSGGGGRSTSSASASAQTPSSSRSSSSQQQQQQHSQSQQQTQQRQQPQPPPTSRPVQLGDLQNILSSMNIPQPDQKPPEEQIALNEVVTPDVLRPLSSDSEVVDQITPHLPPTSEGAEAVLLSPQFQQALGAFGSALQSGQLGHLMSEFGLGQSVVDAANSGNVRGFAEALQSSQAGEGDAASGGSEEGETAAGKESKKEESSEQKQDN